MSIYPKTYILLAILALVVVFAFVQMAIVNYLMNEIRNFLPKLLDEYFERK